MNQEKEKKEIKGSEAKKCRDNPYYFATTYLQINGKPFITGLSEEEFNKQFNGLYDNPRIRNRYR